MTTTDLLTFAERERVAALGELDAANRITLGQFFTPVEAARLIVSMPSLPASGTLRVLDPGAGSGMLSAAVVERVLAERPNLRIEVIAVEKDPAVLPHLRATLEHCEAISEGRVTCRAHNADFILDSIGLDASLDLGTFDLVIQNPPYGKLGVSTPARKAMRAAGIDVPNLYAAFLALSITLLKPGGQLVAITPRSFFNGPYFSEFRDHLLNSLALNRIHEFGSRSSVFEDSGVLQENVIFTGTHEGLRNTVTLSESKDHTDNCVSRVVRYNEVVYPDDPHRFIRLANCKEDIEIADQMISQPCSLTDLGVQASTGRVVDFRSRHALRDSEQIGSTPLIYPGNLRSGRVEWPRQMRKPQWFAASSDKDRSLLLPSGWYTVVKRFSAKEERRRIVAATWSPETYPGQIAFENHLNVFHIDGSGLDEYLAKGLTAWLNSKLVDKYFRTFSGHTQVNATDLRTIRFPSVDELREIGRSGVTSADDFVTESELVAA